MLLFAFLKSVWFFVQNLIFWLNFSDFQKKLIGTLIYHLQQFVRIFGNNELWFVAFDFWPTRPMPMTMTMTPERCSKNKSVCLFDVYRFLMLWVCVFYWFLMIPWSQNYLPFTAPSAGDPGIIISWWFASHGSVQSLQNEHFILIASKCSAFYLLHRHTNRHQFDKYAVHALRWRL